jgi:hypothetical protein
MFCPGTSSEYDAEGKITCLLLLLRRTGSNETCPSRIKGRPKLSLCLCTIPERGEESKSRCHYLGSNSCRPSDQGPNKSGVSSCPPSKIRALLKAPTEHVSLFILSSKRTAVPKGLTEQESFNILYDKRRAVRKGPEDDAALYIPPPSVRWN